MKKCMLIGLVLILGTSVLFAGGKSDGAAKPAAAETPAAASTAGTTLTIYTNSGSDGRGDWLVARAAKDGFKVQFIEAGAAAIQSRLIAEKNAPVADVVFGLNAIIWESLKAQNILIKYTPVWANEVPAALNDPAGYYTAIVKQAILLAYDKNQLSSADAPTDWLDLWNNPKYKDMYETQKKLTGGTTRIVIAGVLTRYADPNGDLGISEEGWKQIQLYYKNGRLSEDGVDLYAQMANKNNKVVCGQIWSSGIEARDKQYGTNSGYVVPKVGVPFAVEGVAIVNGTKNVKEAQRFVDWFGSAQIQGEWAKQFSTLPANEKAIKDANAFNQTIGSLPAQKIDWALVSKNIDKWCEKIELKYMP